jgi:hypothetical protein
MVSCYRWSNRSSATWRAPHPSPYAALSAKWHAVQAGEADPKTELAEQIRGIEAKQERLSQRIVNATKRYLDGDISKAAYDGLVAADEADFEQIATHLDALRVAQPEPIQLPLFEQVIRSAIDWTVLLDNPNPPIAALRDMLSPLIERVVPRRVGFGKYEVDVEWTLYGRSLSVVAAYADLEAVERRAATQANVAA